MFLPNNMLVQILEDLLRWRRRFAIEPRLVINAFLLLAVHLAEDDKEVMALLALDEARRADERLDVRAGIAALRAGESVFVFATAGAASCRCIFAAAAREIRRRWWRCGIAGGVITAGRC